MGSKGATTTTNQNQTYTPAGGSYITNALNQAQTLGGQSNTVPTAPVAGFSQDQLSAFQNVNNAQGMAQPYINQAQQYFTPQGAQQFFNPAVDAVTAQMQNIFGQQNTQNTANLTQSAGGVGADRIAVGQGNMANQQGLAAGQTYSNLWNSAVQQAQGAGYGTAALGSQAQNAALQGAQAQLGTGGLQQQLSQAQLNAPYQQQLAQQQLPYQQASWLSNIVGSLAPGLGGTTQGQGSQTSPGPSMWSQILGGAGVGTALAGYGSQNGWFGGSGGNGLATGSAIPGASGPTSVNGAPLNTSTYWQGGGVNPFAEGGGVSDAPIDVSAQSFMPQQQIAKIQPHVPQLNLTPQQPQGGGGGSGGPGIGDIAKMAMMFLARGGSVNPFADGGRVRFSNFRRSDNIEDRRGDNDPAYSGMAQDLGAESLDRKLRPSINDALAKPSRLSKSMGVGTLVERLGYAEGGGSPYDITQTPGYDKLARAMNEKLGGAGEVNNAQRVRGIDVLSDAMNDEGFDSVNPGDPIRRDPEADNAWRQGATAAMPTDAGAPPPQAPARSAGVPNPHTPPSGALGAATNVSPAADHGAGAGAAPAKDGNDFIKSPWAALMAAGLGIAGGSSPFAGVNIGQGGLQGLKMLEQQRTESQKDTTIEQAARRLELEAKHHEDQYTRATPYQQFEMKKPVPTPSPTSGPPPLMSARRMRNW